MLSKEVLSTIFKVLGMTQPGIEPRSPEPLTKNTNNFQTDQFDSKLSSPTLSPSGAGSNGNEVGYTTLPGSSEQWDHHQVQIMQSI